jgi:hypothetical protein
MPRSPIVVLARALTLVLALVLAACGQATPSPSAVPTSGPTATGVASGCPEAPAPSEETLAAWDPSIQRPTLFPVIISSRLVCGENRFMFGFLDLDNRPVGAPDRTVSVAFYDLGADGTTPTASVAGSFLWAIEGTRGVYTAPVELGRTGLWGAEFTTQAPGSPAETIRVQFQVAATSPVVAIGARAPASDTPTLADVGGDPAAISTDADPVPAFYETSVADAVAAGRPFVLAFATPKFCTSAQCGPTLDRLKPIAAAHPDVTFINVEPFELELVGGQLQPVLTNGQLTPVAATIEWGLLSEPWVFVVGRDGIVRGSFEGVVGDEELEAVLRQVAPGA